MSEFYAPIIIPPPPARKFPASWLTKEDTGKFYGYHGEASHHINNCIELKRAVENWLKKGNCSNTCSGRGM